MMANLFITNFQPNVSEFGTGRSTVTGRSNGLQLSADADTVLQGVELVKHCSLK